MKKKPALSNVDYSLINNKQPPRVMIVEDDVFTIEFLSTFLTRAGYQVVTANNGQECLSILSVEYNHIDVILMDREMPILDGIETVGLINDDPEHSKIPVIMLTSADTREDVLEGLEVGVYQYLTKPIDKTMLNILVKNATRKSRHNKILGIKLKQHRRGFGMLSKAEFEFRTIHEAESLAAFIAHCFPDPEKILWAVYELMINAIEHGNLAVDKEDRANWVTLNIWEKEIEYLLTMQEHKKKKVSLKFSRRAEGFYITIEDEGDGFDWEKYTNIDLKNIDKELGHSIVQARDTAFDHLTYNDKGNQVIAFVATE